jgi:hypothetical protein
LCSEANYNGKPNGPLAQLMEEEETTSDNVSADVASMIITTAIGEAAPEQ